MNKEELRNVDGSDSLHPSRSGDVVVVSRPPYQSDAATPGQTIAFSQFFGQHGYLPNLVDLAHNINMHATFVAGGPGVKHKDHVDGRAGDRPRADARVPDGHPRPAERPRQDPLRRSSSDAENAQGDHDPRHQRLARAADRRSPRPPTRSGAGAVNPTFAIGGAAFLKPWFDVYEAEAALQRQGRAHRVAGGDSFGGATPPISNFFGDKPTIEIMNMMGIDVDGARQPQLRPGADVPAEQADPAGRLPVRLGEHRRRRTGTTPPEWSPSHVFELPARRQGRHRRLLERGHAERCVFPGSLGPFARRDRSSPRSTPRRPARETRIDAIVASATWARPAGRSTDPTGPLIDLADGARRTSTWSSATTTTSRSSRCARTACS